jgi:hypothetical protein
MKTLVDGNESTNQRAYNDYETIKFFMLFWIATHASGLFRRQTEQPWHN